MIIDMILHTIVFSNTHAATRSTDGRNLIVSEFLREGNKRNLILKQSMTEMLYSLTSTAIPSYINCSAL